MNSPHDYYLNVIGKGFDEDGVYGCQCVDGFKHFCRTVLGLSLGSICNPTGYATSIWDNFDSLGLNNYFDKVPANQMVDGDWAIWDMNSKSCPYSHVAMFRKDNGNGTGIFLGQNQNSHPEFTQVNIYYDGLRGGLRPKIYHQNNVSINHPVCITLGDMYVRDNAGLDSRIKKVSELTEDGRRNAKYKNDNDDAIYKAGTKFSVLDTVNKDGLWAKTPSGYVCLIGKSGRVYCRDVNESRTKTL